MELTNPSPETKTKQKKHLNFIFFNIIFLLYEGADTSQHI